MVKTGPHTHKKKKKPCTYDGEKEKRRTTKRWLEEEGKGRGATQTDAVSRRKEEKKMWEREESSLCATHTQKGHREKGMEKKKILPQVVSSTYGGGRESEGEKRVS